MYLVTGSNLFGQWFKKDNIFKTFISIGNQMDTFNVEESVIELMTWSYTVFRLKNKFYVSGTWKGNDNQLTELTISKLLNTDHVILSGNDYNLLIIDLKLKILWIKNLAIEGDIREIKLNTEMPLEKLRTDHKRMRQEDEIIKVVSTNHSCLILTSTGMVYVGELPTFIDTNHCVGKVIDVACGYEHFMLLTDAGRVYTWGNGRRLQLGHGDLCNIDIPKEVDALAGIKIVKISSGGWHSLVLSEFSDIYAWGWNDMGQLGIREYSKKSNGFLPSLIDIFDENDEGITLNIVDIACGTRHSVIMMEDYSIWSTGYNKYGQLGFDPEIVPNVNYFKKCFHCENKFNLSCGPWSTVLTKVS